jgi:hypothetical protein
VLCEIFNNAQGVVKVERLGAATGLVPDSQLAVPKTSGGFLCPTTVFFTANAENSRITLLGAATLITIRLI